MTGIDSIGVLILFAALIFSRIISGRSARYLSDEEKLKFAEAFTGIRKYSLIPLAAILLLFYFTFRYLQNYRMAMLVIYFSLLVGYVFALNSWIYTRLRKLGINATYLRYYILSRTIPFIGITAFAVLFMMKNMALGSIF